MVKNHQALLYDVMLFKNKGDKVIFMWVPAHMGIIRKIAKKALQKESIEASISLSKSEGKSIVCVWGGGGGIIKEWQQRCDQELKGRHLYLIIKKTWHCEK